MFWKFQKIHEQLLFKDMEKLEALSEMVQKVYDLKKESLGKIHKGIQILSETLIEWSLLFYNINVEYCNTLSVSSCIFCKPFA